MREEIARPEVLAVLSTGVSLADRSNSVYTAVLTVALWRHMLTIFSAARTALIRKCRLSSDNSVTSRLRLMPCRIRAFVYRIVPAFAVITMGNQLT